NLNYFDDLGLKYEPGEDGKVVVVVTVKEKQTGMFQLSAGWSNRDGPLGILSLKKDNLLGRGQSVSADLTVSRNPSADLTYFNPWIDPQHTSLGVSLYDSRYANYLNQGLSPLSNHDGYGLLASSFSQEERRGAQLTLGRPLFGDPVTAVTRGSLALKGEWIGVQREGDETIQPGQTNPVDANYYASPQDTVSGHIAGGALQANSVAYDLGFSLAGTLTYDTRDILMNPTRGWFNSVSLEQYTGPLLGDLDLTRANLSLNKYLPVWPNGTVLAFGTQLGTTLSFWKHKIPTYERYYATGPYLIRGWPEVLPSSNTNPGYAALFEGDSLGIASIEYRFPIWNILSGVLFGDTGIFWDQQAPPGAIDAFDWSHLRSGYGVGIRVNTPLGPLRLDLGINRWRWSSTFPWHPLEWPWQDITPHFSIGQKF
ncbi:MAG: BamA/TamA family outer membrane protein, partial [Cyanobacteria bacterium REEB65]|nr:BamA/TamA family outer membrane protein [Cyanobacteria bacterium REEB65]